MEAESAFETSGFFKKLDDGRSFCLVVKGPAADATDALQPWGLLCNPVMKVMIIIIFCPFPSNGAPVEWNWQGKTEVLGEKPVPVPFCPPQIPHALTPGSNPGLRGGRPAANRLSHGTAMDEVKEKIMSVSYIPPSGPCRVEQAYVHIRGT
jgi:hypothetical protein